MKEATRQSYRTINITEKDVAKAKRNDSYKCVVAQAIARTFPDAHHIEVDTQTIRFTDRDQRKAYLTPYAVQGYVVAFDAGDKIEPFSFQLRKPVPIRQKRLTAAGRIAHRAKQKARERAKKAQSVDSTIDPKLAAREAYAAARIEHPGPPETIRHPASRQAPPRVFKAKHRTYGMRVLRINRERAAASLATEQEPRVDE